MIHKDQNKLSILIILVLIAIIIWTKPFNDDNQPVLADNNDLFHVNPSQLMLFSAKHQSQFYYSSTKLKQLEVSGQGEFKNSPFE